VPNRSDITMFAGVFLLSPCLSDKLRCTVSQMSLRHYIRRIAVLLDDMDTDILDVDEVFAAKRGPGIVLLHEGCLVSRVRFGTMFGWTRSSYGLVEKFESQKHGMPLEHAETFETESRSLVA
jgi:hypothetical protein